LNIACEFKPTSLGICC